MGQKKQIVLKIKGKLSRLIKKDKLRQKQLEKLYLDLRSSALAVYDQLYKDFPDIPRIDCYRINISKTTKDSVTLDLLGGYKGGGTWEQK